ncbi:protein kinase [Planobispora siamensis]|uniref:non-specific serine/threonine protein kinase n=1 Tax=Planobispora siamensis TaxID=936338 RepID=A0A8J3SEH4_9ACTN|nr:serine/threonine-protein kinase [Planobispora siamensis]GIH90429.1 hypothetical protein Psi01_10590 [Planobispora siamensis]
MAHPHGGRAVAGRYTLMRELGRGGMGVVWEGYDTVLDRPVAVKEVLLPPHLSPAEHERQLTRTSREARTAARLNHPGIVAVYDVAEEDGRPWIIMELVRARGLDEVGSLPVRQVAHIGRQVLSALHVAHQAGIMHRDVKPSNILLTSEGRAVLTDFGIATVEGDVSLTQTGMVTGSPSFLPPERATGTPAGPWSDLWALGATLYAMLVGRAPFERQDAISTLGALLTEEADFSPVPPEMYEVLYGLMQREPAHRLTAEQADALLAEVSGDTVTMARRSGVHPSVLTASTPGTDAAAGRLPVGQFSTGQRLPGGNPQARLPDGPPQTGHSPVRQPTAPSHPVRGRGAGAAEPRRRRGPVAVVVALAVVLLGAGAAGWIMSAEDGQVAAEAAPAADEPSAASTADDEPAEKESEKPASPKPEPSPTRSSRPAAARPDLAVTEKDDWSIKHPEGWRAQALPGGAGVRWTRPDGDASMSVEVMRSIGDLESLWSNARADTARRSQIITQDWNPVTTAYGSGLDWRLTWRPREDGATGGDGDPGEVGEVGEIDDGGRADEADGNDEYGEDAEYGEGAEYGEDAGSQEESSARSYRETRRFIEVGDIAVVLTWVVPAEEGGASDGTMRSVFDSFQVWRRVT